MESRENHPITKMHGLRLMDYGHAADRVASAA